MMHDESLLKELKLIWVKPLHFYLFGPLSFDQSLFEGTSCFQYSQNIAHLGVICSNLRQRMVCREIVIFPKPSSVSHNLL